MDDVPVLNSAVDCWVVQKWFLVCCKDLLCVSWYCHCTVSDVDAAGVVLIDDVDLRGSRHVFEVHIVEDDALVLFGEFAEVVHVSDPQRWLGRHAFCPRTFAAAARTDDGN